MLSVSVKYLHRYSTSKWRNQSSFLGSTKYWPLIFCLSSRSDRLLLFNYWIFYCLLPPASEGWGKVIFSVCPRLQGVPHPADEGGTPSQVWPRGYPIPGLDRGGYPISRSRWGVPHSQVWTESTQSQVWMGVYLEYPPPIGTGWGTPKYGLDGVPPNMDWMGYPQLGLDG